MSEEVKKDAISLSFSKTSSYAGCSLKYYFHYVDKVPIPVGTSIARDFGTVVHESLENLHESFASKPMTLHQVLEQFTDTWQFEARVSDGDYTDKEIDSHEIMGRVMLSKYYKKNQGTSWFVPPVGAEIGFEVPLVNLWTGDVIDERINLRGFIDLVHEVDGRLGIVDHKTSTKAYTPFRVNNDLQLTMYKYAVLYLQEQGKFEAPRKYEIDEIDTYFNVFQKYPRTDVQKLRGDRTREDIERMYVIIQRAIDGIDKEVYVPNFASGLCTYCDYVDVCQNYWGRFENWKEQYIADQKETSQ